MATTTRIPIEVFLQSDEYEPAADYVDGEVEERPMGELDHSSWQLAIQLWFVQNAQAWNILIQPELRVQTGTTRFRVADVAVLDGEAPRGQITTYPPLAIFEVLSPEDRVQRLTRKLGEYAARGVAEIWVVDPESEVFFRFEEGQLLRRDRFIVSKRAIDFPVSEIVKLVSRPT